MPTDEQLFSNWRAEFYGFGGGCRDREYNPEYPSPRKANPSKFTGEVMGTIHYDPTDGELHVEIKTEQPKPSQLENKAKE